MMNKILASCLITFIYSSPAFSAHALVNAGGYGGTPRTGVLTYDGMPTHLPAFHVIRSDDGTCRFINEYSQLQTNDKDITYDCKLTSPTHQGLYWSGNFGSINDGNSPENDVMFAATQTIKMFNDWYQLAYNNITNLSMPIHFHLHEGDATGINAEKHIFVSDGNSDYYPATSLTEVSKLISIAYFMQSDSNNNIDYDESISIAFNNMTAMAVEYYTTGKNSWKVDNAYKGDESKAYQYLDQPSKNCGGRQPGDNCDIDTLAQYTNNTLYVNSSGLFSRAFYLLATTNNWNTRKAYDVFLDAKLYHWQNHPDFHSAACDVLDSAKEENYDTYSVVLAFSGVGIDIRDCANR